MSCSLNTSSSGQGCCGRCTVAQAWAAGQPWPLAALFVPGPLARLHAMATSDYPRLLGDVGGTNVRFALQEAPHGAPQRVRRYPTGEHPTFADAVRRYLADEGLSGVAHAAIGIANPVTG